ncbi:MAG: molybdate ABC transporter substrate-binding protein [Actinomycetota bacterium]|nr:molybdate ABC transporter substrate-binding protein [Actinomycetota bacterium]
MGKASAQGRGRLRLHSCPAVTIGLILVLASLGCSTVTTRDSGPGASSPAASAKASGPLTVFAAASLTEPFNDEMAILRASSPGLSVTFSFGGSGALVAQVQQGAPADVVATADTASMRRLIDAGLVDPPVTFARNKLQILVAPGDPKGVTSLADLARPDLKVVLGDESVPAGRYAAQVLQTAGVAVRPVSKEPDVKAAVSKVTTGEADATIVYATDVRAAGGKGQGIEIPDGQNVLADYPIAVVKATPHRAAAAAFVEATVRGGGQAALGRRGFLPAP